MIVGLQEQIFTKLDSSVDLGAVVVGVYDEVPQFNDSGNNANYPYVVIGEDTTVEWDTDTETGFEVVTTIHVWSRYSGLKETKQIQKLIYNILNRTELIIPDYCTLALDFVGADSFLDTDGLTRHGVQTFRTFLENI